MNNIAELETNRLTLRQWKKSDWPLFAKINADPEVMAYYPMALTEIESNRMADKLSALIAERGWGFWAVEEKNKQRFIGFVGLHIPVAELPFSPCVEIGWRLAQEYWGRGYATEAANAALRFAFTRLHLLEVYSFASVPNKRSQAVMQRLHMLNTQQNFEHPSIPANSTSSHLREHVLYKITKEHWRLQNTKNDSPLL